MTTTTDTRTTETTAVNLALAEAFAEVAGILTNRAELPEVVHGGFNTHGAVPKVDLWFAEPEHVDAWAEAFGVAAVSEPSHHSADRPFVTREAKDIDRHYVRLSLIQMAYLDTTDEHGA
jgi:hypothetical protein